MALWLKVEMEESGQTTKESLKKLWTRPAIIFFSFVLIMGYGWGVRDTYLFAYLGDELGASSSLISMKGEFFFGVKFTCKIFYEEFYFKVT